MDHVQIDGFKEKFKKQNVTFKKVLLSIEKMPFAWNKFE